MSDEEKKAIEEFKKAIEEFKIAFCKSLGIDKLVKKISEIIGGTKQC